MQKTTMRGVRLLRRVLATGMLFATPTATLGQETRFLEPADATVALGERVSLAFVASDVAQEWTGLGVEYFFARTAWTQENRDSVSVAADSGGLAAAWVAGEPGVLLLGVDLAARVETVSAESFAAFVRRVLPASRRGDLVGLLESGRAEGTVAVQRVESGKALVRVEAGGSDPVSIATSKTGQAVEIRPLMDPTAIELGSDLAVRVYSRVPGPSDGVVIATNTTTGEVVRAPTNETSLAIIPIESAGKWRLEFHAVDVAAAGLGGDGEGEHADWIVHTATLTFVVPVAASDEEVAR